MVHVRKDGDFYKASRITGPTHNFLAIKFGDSNINIERLEPHNSDSTAVALDPETIKQEVLRGIERANKRLGTAYRAAIVQFVPDDSPPVSIYSLLAEEIVITKHATSMK